MSIDVYPPKGLLVPGTQQVTETLAGFGYVTATGAPSTDIAWEFDLDKGIQVFWNVPMSYAGGSVTFTWLRRPNATGGVAVMDYNVLRFRDNTAATALETGSVNLSPVDTVSHILQVSVAAAGFLPGDSLRVRVTRTGTSASDTNTNSVSMDGVTVTYLATTPRVFNAQPYEEGTFTVTATGFSGTAPSGTARYVRIGKQVTLVIPQNVTGTSNATTMTLTGIPAALVAPITLQAAFQVADNGANLTTPGIAQWNAGVTTINLYTNWQGGVWTASGLKGWGQITFSYVLA